MTKCRQCEHWRGDAEWRRGKCMLTLPPYLSAEVSLNRTTFEDDGCDLGTFWKAGNQTDS